MRFVSNMSHAYRSLILFLLVFLQPSVADKTEWPMNFVPQLCTDIPIAFDARAAIKCIQLVPKHDRIVHNMSVQNYILKKFGACYQIVSLETPFTSLFPHVCNEVCIDEYNLLFNNQSNQSIYNIFYSPSEIYPADKIPSENRISYDYFAFDQCSVKTKKDQDLLIVICVLCGVIAVLTIAVVAKYIVSCILKRRGPPYEPYNWRWILDLILCRVSRDDCTTPEPTKRVTEVFVDPGQQQSNSQQNLIYPSNNFDLVSQSYMTSSTDQNRTLQSSNENSRTDHDSSSDVLREAETPVLSFLPRSTYIDATVESESTVFTANDASFITAEQSSDANSAAPSVRESQLSATIQRF